MRRASKTTGREPEDTKKRSTSDEGKGTREGTQRSTKRANMATGPQRQRQPAAAAAAKSPAAASPRGAPKSKKPKKQALGAAPAADDYLGQLQALCALAPPLMGRSARPQTALAAAS